MSRTIIDVLVLSFLVNYVIPIFGNLTTLRGPTINGWKKVICLSEDDGGALVWNSDLRYSYHKTYIIDTKAKKFSSTCDVQSSQIDCKLNDINECLNLWDKDYWQLVTSLDKPMGPVFDERWEGIDKPSETQIIFTNQTTIIANAPIKWEEKYERVELLYSFEIKTPDGSFKDQQQWNTFQDSTQLVGIFANLQPGTTYQIRCILSINESILYADWINAITDCNLITNFHITPNETSLEISVDDNENQMYPCPLDSYVVLYKKNDDESDGGTPRAIPYFPYTLISLTPYTTYNVIISHGTRNVSFERIRTHEGVPSEILTFQAMPLSSSQVSLLWTPPGQPNGEIKEYVVYLKVYFGCPNHQQPSQNNYTIVERTDKTKVTLSELHAYAMYDVLVVAYNSRHSSEPARTTFHMNASTPDAPRNFTISVGHNSVIDMKWFHPWRTGGRLLCFKITIVQISSYLTNNYRRSAESMPHKFDVMNYQRNYSMQLFLLPSTQYNISIISVTTKRKNNSTSPLNFWTPSTINFNGDVTFDVHESDITISVNVPSIVNDTLNSILYIVVKGPNPCKNYLPPRKDLWEQAGMKKYDIAWQAVAVSRVIARRKQQKSNKQLMLQDEMALSQNIETYEHDAKSVISDSKQAPSTPSDRQSLSRATTPDVPTIEAENNDEEKEMISLMKVKDFEDYVRQAIESGLLDKQYETFPRGQTQSWDYGKLPQNKTKNRYGNLIAYDETRVILKKLPDDAHSDYINANYITGYKKKKRYIATQGPKPNTVVDFWRMIWQEKVLIICMLANVIENGKTKCEQYWPDIGKKKKYGEIIVLNATHNVFADYCFRTLHITYEKETRKVEHLHYTAWPDHGVPLYTHSVVTYLKKLLATPPGDGPVVVHCSAGVGRTGTIILCDICLHRAAAEGVVDVFAETASIRRERANMVDNKQQYLLAHLALVECLLIIPTTLPCNETLPTRIKELKKQLPVQQQRLQDTAWQDEALRPVTSPLSLSERNRAKNRFPELISDKVSRIYLKRYPASDEDSDYLSAVYVDGVRLQNQYLATQLPLPSTINDFWRMIAEFKVELIVMLQQPDPEDSSCCAIAPASGEFKPTPYLNITAKEIVESENYTSQKLLLIDNSEKPPREQSVTILCCTEWKPGRNQPPPSVMTMVTFWQATERIARASGPTVTLCHDGVTGCGLYLALSFMLERMAVERECDVCLAVRAVRRSRPDFVRSVEYLEYLYDAALTYLEYFETYANFS
ncbi:Receptor-type tyrosine-protein phosphatase kappa [Harpegnathos saltator]|uniref:protein-tyrosine-phosphatase n=1 Tax=Harpegnathos saltator TaxID=610380 RepID=E2B9P9_HARSA|nr:Receptor-type tyrosine-protein phosphatase kappa [Harpegnathos saltator]